MNDYKYVNYAWEDEVASKLEPVTRLVYRSNLLGSDQRITNTGGGNTSSKISMPDPLTGEPAEVLWVKGSGGDLRTSNRANFASLYLDKLKGLQKLYAQAEVKGVKSEIEDRMVELYPHTVFNLNPRASSIDTPLHAFIPFQHVDHTHPNAVIAVAASQDQERLTREIYGDEIGWVPWQRPGFDLGLVLQAQCRQNPNLKGIVLGQHGLINWANDDKACYELSLGLIEKAARFIEAHDKGAATFGGQKYEPLPAAEREALLAHLLPRLRGLVSQQQRFIATVQSDPAMLRFANSYDAPRLAELGTSCPDHFLRTKIKPLYVDWQPDAGDLESLLSKLESGLAQYRRDYAAYYEACQHPDSPAMRDPNPTVILIPGVGMVAWGANKSESRVTAEFYNCAVEVMRGAEAISRYVALPRQEAFDIEYWALEEAKLRRMPPEKELARHVVVVVGAGSGIGKATAHRLAREGAHVVCADLDGEAAGATAQELTGIHGPGIGVAGTGISACGPAVGLQVNIADRSSVQALFRQVALAYGGLDSLVVTAGVYVPPDRDSRIPDDKWALTYAVNVTGQYLMADEAAKIWQAQGLPGSLVLTTSVNATIAKKGSLAYDTSKAAANHLIRELAIELAPLVRVNGLAPATVVEGSSLFPRDRVINSLIKYEIPFSEDEDIETLRLKLAEFYARRSLTRSAITLADQAEAAYLLVSNRLSKTTGQILIVDGGLPEAFLR
ncbi:MAG: bifunctional rhamnulose-1-phosphate aldolase/short-chain dehydrogenase [Chloroflexi bacterium]|nr:bifunctional rhamnulose-1-phosphate aldolase/short-chain dehydrogenase [Chloroflexota bacterium]MCI0576167.1 bifunctional rhamnulose-1-phosphate aldolase/short-chain dehydrogenase [Chloroflexota bacterium]MCI0648980.1 bifunctional rhamnulose-1-phosphate aldolase/short-chain dehydrogenase [Chloroflexota bacterium]MCI0728196.1 bifunctional rhamnulose-1-phosphate aldolase/short-chain dehydrogenase [Chloroflexota bacterium]